MLRHCKVGTYTGNGTSQVLNIGFRPKSVRIINETDGTVVVECLLGMADGKGLKMIGSGAFSMLAANGVTLRPAGFSVGSDNSVNQSNKVFRFIAVA